MTSQDLKDIEYNTFKISIQLHHAGSRDLSFESSIIPKSDQHHTPLLSAHDMHVYWASENGTRVELSSHRNKLDRESKVKSKRSQFCKVFWLPYSDLICLIKHKAERGRGLLWAYPSFQWRLNTGVLIDSCCSCSHCNFCSPSTGAAVANGEC